MSTRAVPMPIEEFRRKAAAGEDLAGVVLYKHFIPDQVKASADSRRITFTISTAAVDREGDTIAVDGWQIDDYLKNPVVLFAHRYDQLPIARAVSIVKSAGALKATAEFPEAGLNPLADTVYEMLKAGFLRATSVGFRPIKSAHNEERPGWATDFLEQELLEFSVVPVPANPEALMETGKAFAGAISAGIDLKPLEVALALAKAVTSKTKVAPLSAPGKSGRTISAATEEAIRTAIESIETAAETLETLLGLEDDDVPDDDDDKAHAGRRKDGGALSQEDQDLVQSALDHCSLAAGHHKNQTAPLSKAVETLKSLLTGGSAGSGDDPKRPDGDQPGTQVESAYVMQKSDLVAALSRAVSAGVRAGLS